MEGEKRDLPADNGEVSETERTRALRQALANIHGLRDEWMVNHIKFTALMDKALTPIDEDDPDNLIGLTEDEQVWAERHILRGETITGAFDAFQREVEAGGLS